MTLVQPFIASATSWAVFEVADDDAPLLPGLPADGREAQRTPAALVRRGPQESAATESVERAMSAPGRVHEPRRREFRRSGCRITHVGTSPRATRPRYAAVECWRPHWRSAAGRMVRIGRSVGPLGPHPDHEPQDRSGHQRAAGRIGPAPSLSRQVLQHHGHPLASETEWSYERTHGVGRVRGDRQERAVSMGGCITSALTGWVGGGGGGCGPGDCQQQSRRNSGGGGGRVSRCG